MEQTGVQDLPEGGPPPEPQRPSVPAEVPARVRMAFATLVQCNEQMRPILVPGPAGAAEVLSQELEGKQYAVFERACSLLGTWLITGKLTACQCVREEKV